MKLTGKKLKFQVKTMLKNSRGFSLIEILIALTLMGIAGTFVAGRIFDSLHEGKVKAAKIQMQSLSQRLQEFRRHCGYYPTSDQGLEALVSKPSTGRECPNYSPNGYIDGDLPLDPWDMDYKFISDGKEYNIISLGADREEGGEGEDADIPMKDQKK
jgi:general secretion pathway protein G